MLLFLITISTPIAKDLYFLGVRSGGNTASTSASVMRLGTLGYCLTDGTVPVVSSATNATTSGCTASKLGYNLDYGLFKSGAVWDISDVDISDSVLKGLTYMLVLQPIGELPWL